MTEIDVRIAVDETVPKIDLFEWIVDSLERNLENNFEDFTMFTLIDFKKNVKENWVEYNGVKNELVE